MKKLLILRCEKHKSGVREHLDHSAQLCFCRDVGLIRKNSCRFVSDFTTICVRYKDPLKLKWSFFAGSQIHKMAFTYFTSVMWWISKWKKRIFNKKKMFLILFTKNWFDGVKWYFFFQIMHIDKSFTIRPETSREVWIHVDFIILKAERDWIKEGLSQAFTLKSHVTVRVSHY